MGKRNSSTSEIRPPASIGLVDILSTPLFLLHCLLSRRFFLYFHYYPVICGRWIGSNSIFLLDENSANFKGRNLSTLLWQTMLSCRYNITRETHMLDSEELLVDTVAVAFAMAIYFVHMKIMDIRCHVRCGNKRC